MKDFRINIANELTRDELIDRLYETTELYRKLREQWFENELTILKPYKMKWIKVTTEKDLPIMGQRVIVCRDLGEKKQYYTTEWDSGDKRFWGNNIVGWAEFDEFE